MPGESGVTVVTNACAFYHCTRGCGRIGRPAFPAPSDLQGARRKWQHSGASGREIAKPWLHTAGCLKIESVATHSVRTHAPLFVVPAKAGTHNHLRLLEQKPLATVPKREAAAYGSPLSRGRP